MTLLRVLLIEDSASDAWLLQRALERAGLRFELHRIKSPEALEACLFKDAWDLVISDYRLPRFTGLDALQRVRAWDPDVPFILVSGTAGEELAVTAIRAGANDFLLKDNLARLPLVVEREMRESAIHQTQRLHANELRMLHQAINRVPDGILVTDAEGAIVYANPAMEAISGYSAPELVGQNPRLLKSGRHDPAFYSDLWATLKRGETWQGAFVNRRKDGTLWEAEASIAPVTSPDGTLVSYVCTQRDVTRERELQSQLEQSQRLEAIGVLSAGIAHDFNNILTPILAHAELGLARMNLPEDLRRDLEVIVASAQRAATLTQQVLGFARTQTHALQEIEFTSLLKESLKLLRAAIPTTIQFRLQMESQALYVFGNPTQLHQVLLNLCSNAAHAMRGVPGSLTIALSRDVMSETVCIMGQTLPAGDYVILEVADTGCGMDEATLARAFMPFFTTKASGEGTGLGLSIVLGIVQEMKGGLRVESEPGMGTRIWVFLPHVPHTAAKAFEQVVQVPLGTERILLVDDEAILASSIRVLLESLGYEVTVFRRPQDALAAMQAEPARFDLLLTDFTMPAMTGLVLTERVRALRPGLPVLMMTGGARPDLAEVPPAVAPDGLLAKPFSIRALGRKLREILDR